MTKIVLKDFEKHIIVRPLKIEDYDDIVALQHACFPGMKPWKKEQILSQLEQFPQGQIVIELNGTIVASSSSLILDFDLYEDDQDWNSITDNGFFRNHDKSGDTLYGAEIMVDPKHRGMRLARRLYDMRKELARQNNLMRIVIGGRLPGYCKVSEEIGVREYVDKVMGKELFDPVLTTQLANGFVLKRLILNYLPTDLESGGHATFLEWSNLDYVPKHASRLVKSRPVRVCSVQLQMREVSSFQDFMRSCEYFIDAAADYKSDFVVFPEGLTAQLLSFDNSDRPADAMRRLSEFTHQYLEAFTGLAVKYNVNIVGGTHLTVIDQKLFDVCYLFRRDGTLSSQKKLQINLEEKKWWGLEGGNVSSVIDTDCGKIAIQIGSDIEFPESSRYVAQRGAEIIFVPFASEERYAFWRLRACAQARAVENQVYVVTAGSVGNLPKVKNLDIRYAQSGVYTPLEMSFARYGSASECPPNIETVFFEDLDTELLKKLKRSPRIENRQEQRSAFIESIR